jgi:hypothetical protein
MKVYATLGITLISGKILIYRKFRKSINLIKTNVLLIQLKLCIIFLVSVQSILTIKYTN